MTEKNFLKKYKEPLKKKLEDLKKMSLEEYIYKYKIKMIEETKDYNDAKEFNEYQVLKEKKTLNEKEKELLKDILDNYEDSKKYKIKHLKREIENIENDIKYFSPIENLSIEKWFETYYKPQLEKDLKTKNFPHIIERRFLLIKHINKEINEDKLKELLKNLKKGVNFWWEEESLVINDYQNYLKNQITKTTLVARF